MALTDVKIKNIKPRDKPFKLADEKGLFLLVNPSGSKLWRWKYRYQGKEKLLAFGSYGSGADDVGLKQAREKRDEARKLLAEGQDPSQVRQQKKRDKQLAQVNSFEAVALEYATKKRSSWSPRHHDEFVGRLQDNIFPEIGKRPIAEVQAPDLLAALRKVESRGALTTAQRLRSMCSSILRYGIATGRCSVDIASFLAGALEPPTPGQMNAVRPEALPQLVQDIDGYTGNPIVRLGLQLLMLTFVRPGALVAMRWRDVDYENRVWIVPASSMKLKKADKNRLDGEHLVPLSDWAMSILEELKDYSGNNAYVFPSSRNPAVPMSTDDLLYGLYSLGYRNKMSNHGFRAVASTTLNEQRGLSLHSFSSEVIEKQLAHKEPNKVKGAYNRAMYLKERQDLMDYWSAFLRSFCEDTLEVRAAKNEAKADAISVPQRARRGLGATLATFMM